MRKTLAVLVLGFTAASCSTTTGGITAPVGWMYVQVTVTDTLLHPIAQMPVSVQIRQASDPSATLATSFGTTDAAGHLKGLMQGQAIDVAAVARAEANPPPGSPYLTGADSVNAQFHLSPTPPDTANILIVLR